MDATRTTRQLEETIDLFERQKIRDIKVTEIAQFSVCRVKMLHHYESYSGIQQSEAASKNWVYFTYDQKLIEN